ncbi:MAG: ATP-grasp domain-containing protein, partial [Burkholderiaceae bacterium]|nr:ATP-grasp domain-containing protein [Burkholderiaceae bacterium]
DRHAAHVALADEAVFIGPPAARLSYLNQTVLLKAAGESTADAIHPGYGFLSENAEFAQAVIDAGMRFIGPSPAAISAMGSKANAKALMAAAGVALVPGYYGERQDTDFLKEQAALVGYPVLIKATAGGGGKGMRRVDEAKDFAAALASCQREALSSFGDAQVLIERYIIEPRHIEVQIFGDQHGKIVSLLERDCSLQRRHQKVIEEAPAPGWSPQKRQAMSMAAIAAARSVQYVGAGTVEFIVDPAGDFFFMEMNTRLQVEHPVTEMILGEDLVAWQLKVAMGEPLPAHWEHVEAQGHAIEARLYAENPRRGFLPSMGQVQSLCFPEAAAQFDVSAPIRIDAGIREGDVISGDYDPMIAKIIVHGKDRQQALARMRQALA